MLVCDLCRQEFPVSIVLDGKLRILNRRRYCLNCSPFGSHNTRQLPAKRRERRCTGCGVDTTNPKFCSNRCQRSHQWQHTKRAIDQTGIIPIARGGNSASAKRYILETRGRACEVCGGTEWLGHSIPLFLDHADGNAENWAVSNLRLVCGNCDMLLPTDKSKKCGHGRAWRRERYARGQSY